MPRAPSLPLLRTQSDERLVRLTRQGHERAFEAIVERYRKPLQRQCRWVLSEARAEDAVQQTFLAAWTALRRGDDVWELRPWLHRIARNVALNLARAPGFDYDELRDSLRMTEEPQDDLERRIVMRETLTGIAALPKRQREALLRTAVQGHDQDDIARDLGLSNGAVRQLVHRARETLRAAATAITPLPLAAWLAAATARSEPITQRVAELAAGGAGVGAAATVAKFGAVAVVAGGAVSGPVMFDDPPRSRTAVAPARDHVERPAPKRPARVSAPAVVVSHGRGESTPPVRDHATRPDAPERDGGGDRAERTGGGREHARAEVGDRDDHGAGRQERHGGREDERDDEGDERPAREDERDDRPERDEHDDGEGEEQDEPGGEASQHDDPVASADGEEEYDQGEAEKAPAPATSEHEDPGATREGDDEPESGDATEADHSDD